MMNMKESGREHILGDSRHFNPLHPDKNFKNTAENETKKDNTFDLTNLQVERGGVSFFSNQICNLHPFGNAHCYTDLQTIVCGM